MKAVHLIPATKQVFYNLKAQIQRVWHGLEKNLSSIIKSRVAIQVEVVSNYYQGQNKIALVQTS
jgi:stress-induced morphogen